MIIPKLCNNTRWTKITIKKSIYFLYGKITYKERLSTQTVIFFNTVSCIHIITASDTMYAYLTVSC